MSKPISTRLEEDEIKALNEIAEREHMDRSALLRKFILTQLHEYKMRDAADYYRRGVVSLQEAASKARVTIYEMMAHVERENIRPPAQTIPEIREDLDRAKRVFKKLQER